MAKQRQHLRAAEVAGHVHPVVARHAASVAQQVAHGQAFGGERILQAELGDHLAHGAVPFELAFVDQQAQAGGGINVSVADIAKWACFLLDEGKVNGVPLLSGKSLREMCTPHMHMGRSEHAEIGDSHYGFGLFCENYRGERTFSHSGSWLGWGTLMTVMPERRTGVVVLTNRAPSAVTSMLTYAVFDQFSGREPVDWFARLMPKRRDFIGQQKVERKAREDKRRTGTQPSHALDEYIGDYVHPAYGRIEISRQADGLAWRWRTFSGPLAHWHYDVFTTPYRPAEFHPDELALTFLYDREGRIDRIAAPFEPAVPDIVFQRADTEKPKS